jgi:hypothetical protein
MVCEVATRAMNAVERAGLVSGATKLSVFEYMFS